MTCDKVRQLFDYNPDKGELRRKSGEVVGSLDHGYLRVSVNNRREYVHRVIWLHQYGELPVTIDHIDGDPLNNRLVNLRSVTQQVNCKNTRLCSNNTSGVSGVALFKRTNKWTAFIKVNYNKIHLGYFTDFDDAVVARRAAEIKYNFHPNHGRD